MERFEKVDARLISPPPLGSVGTFFLASPVAFQIFNLNGSSELTNAAYTQMFGSKSLQDYNVLTDATIHAHGYEKLVEAAFHGNVISVPAVWFEVMTSQKKSDQPTKRVAAEITFFPVKNSFGEMTHIGASYKDVTNEIKYAEELKEMTFYFERAEELGSLGSWRSGSEQNGNLIWSKNTYHIFGCTKEDFDASVDSFYEKVHPDDREKVRETSEASLQSGEPYSIDHRIVCPDGRIKWIHESGQAFPADGAKPARFIGVAQDITERKENEENLKKASQMQKLDALGRLAGGVAHDFNNILSVVMLYLEQLLKLDDNEVRQKKIGSIRSHVERAKRLIQQLLTFSRNEVRPRQVAALDDVVLDMREMIERILPEDIKIKFQTRGSKKNVSADYAQLEQIILNLVTNARDAMPKGGTLNISTGEITLNSIDLKILGNKNLVPGDYIYLKVEDTGIGMDPSMVSHIYEPFFTTKEFGKGTGLGLSTVYGIVQQVKGEIEMLSAPDKGTQFTLYFPVCASLVPAVAPTPESIHSPTTANILLVEDQSELRELIATLLASDGFYVVSASSGADAIDKYHKSEKQIDLVITDVIMPEMSGPALMKNLDPKIPVIYISGYTNDELARYGIDPSKHMFLTKPFHSADLIRSINESLNRNRLGLSARYP